MKKLPLLLTASIVFSSSQLTAICPCACKKKDPQAQITAQEKEENQSNAMVIGTVAFCTVILALHLAIAANR